MKVLILIIQIGIVEASPSFNLVYVIQEGDTLSEIADDYGLKISYLLELNHLSRNSWIKVGQEIFIPQKEVEDKPNWSIGLLNSGKDNLIGDFLVSESNYSVRINPGQKLPEVNIPRSQIIKYHIGVGDTLFDLARSFNTSIGVIMALNNMKDSIIRVGKKILLPINNLTPHQVIEKTIKKSDIDLLARTIYAEARGEPFIGQVAVGAVIINRVISSYFPDTFYRVIYQPGQFTAVSDGQINLRPNKTSYIAAEKAIEGTDPTMGSLYYYNPKIAKNKWWFSTRRLMVTIGDHIFAK